MRNKPLRSIKPLPIRKIVFNIFTKNSRLGAHPYDSKTVYRNSQSSKIKGIL